MIVNNWIIKVYVALLIFLMPIDWFSPTGLLFREFGAKPMSLILACGGIMGLFIYSNRKEKISLINDGYYLFVGFICFSGIFAFFLNLTFGWSYRFSNIRDPLMQFILQYGLFLVGLISLIGNARIFQRFDILSLIIKYLPYVVIIHLIFFSIEGLGLALNETGSFFNFFRTESGLIDRPSGLMSEPSYFGVMAAMYGGMLIFSGGSERIKFFNLCLSVFLFLIVVFISAKTFFLIVLIQCIGWILKAKKNVFKLLIYVVILLFVFISLYFFYANSIDVNESLSSAMRLGSAVLALNILAEGYGIIGIGVGQFHFFYKESFSPLFLTYSREAQEIFNGDVDSRASSYNFYIRFLIEFGLPSFLILIYGIYKIFKKSFSNGRDPVLMLFCGSLGFLLTQDTYFYPPLIFSAALIIAHRNRLQFGCNYKNNFI